MQRGAMISPLKTCLRTFPALLLLLTLGCITSPIPVTPEQIASADYGTVPVSPAYQDAIKGYMQEILFDPRTARYRFVGEPQRGYAYLLGRRKPRSWVHRAGGDQCEGPEEPLYRRATVSILYQERNAVSPGNVHQNRSGRTCRSRRTASGCTGRSRLPCSPDHAAV